MEDQLNLPGMTPPEPPQRQHALVEPRLMAAVGLVALGSGTGIGLMLAHTLIAIGLTISLASALGVIWIYAQHWGAAYQRWRKPEYIQGCSMLHTFEWKG